MIVFTPTWNGRATIFWAAKAEYSTVPELGMKFVSVPEIAPEAAVTFRSLVPPFSVPAVSATEAKE